MTAVQLDLFAPSAETRRLVDGLTCLRDSVPTAMEMVIHLAYGRTQDERGICAGGDWAYSIRREGLRFEHIDDWPGWDHTPAHRITWAELTELLGEDPRRAELTTWAQSLDHPAWGQLIRPKELWPHPEQWHPDHIVIDRQHPDWDRRIAAWRTLLAILTDAMTRLDLELT